MQSFADYLSIVETHLKNCVPDANPETLYSPIRYTLEGGGKRIRPVLLLAACEAVGGKPKMLSIKLWR